MPCGLHASLAESENGMSLNRKKQPILFHVAAVCAGFGVLSLLSTALYVLFDFRWWVPVPDASLRGFLLIMFHILGLVVGACGGFAILDGEEVYSDR